MAKKSPRTFLCIGGPLSGMALALSEIEENGYVCYNRASQYRSAGYYPTALLIHKSVLGDTLEIARKEVS